MKFECFHAPLFVLAASLVCFAPCSFATTFPPGSNIGFSLLAPGGIGVSIQYIDFDYFGGVTGTPPVAISPLDATGAGIFNVNTATAASPFEALIGSNIFIRDLCRTGAGPCATPVEVGVLTSFPNFITFAARPTWSVTLTDLLPGIDGTAGCASITVGDTCTPSAPGLLSPFNLQNVTNGVIVGFSFTGTIVDSAEGLVSQVTGQFSQTVPGTIPDIVSNVTGVEAIVNGGTGSLLIVGAAIPVQLNCAAATTDTVGGAYSSGLMAIGGVPPYTFSIVTGSLPPGLSLNPSTGVISGMPTMAGTFSSTAQVKDSTGATATSPSCSIMITSPPPPLTLACAASTGTVGTAYSSGLVATGGVPPYTFSISSSTLPPGLTLNASTGAITGTPTSAGTINFMAKVVDSSGTSAGTVTSNCPITISSPSPLVRSDTATIGFWQNQNGQALLDSVNGSPTSTALGNWLATNFPNLFGAGSSNNLTRATNTQVAASFLTAFGNVGGVQGNTYVQVFATALAAYVTSTNLAGSVPLTSTYGFNVSPAGIGAKVFDVGGNGAAAGVPNGTSLTVFQLLAIANANFNLATSLFYGGDRTLASELNNIFDGINQGGDIT